MTFATDPFIPSISPCGGHCLRPKALAALGGFCIVAGVITAASLAAVYPRCVDRFVVSNELSSFCTHIRLAVGTARLLAIGGMISTAVAAHNAMARRWNSNNS